MDKNNGNEDDNNQQQQQKQSMMITRNNNSRSRRVQFNVGGGRLVVVAQTTNQAKNQPPVTIDEQDSSSSCDELSPAQAWNSNGDYYVCKNKKKNNTIWSLKFHQKRVFLHLLLFLYLFFFIYLFIIIFFINETKLKNNTFLYSLLYSWLTFSKNKSKVQKKNRQNHRERSDQKWTKYELRT